MRVDPQLRSPWFSSSPGSSRGDVPAMCLGFVRPMTLKCQIAIHYGSFLPSRRREVARGYLLSYDAAVQIHAVERWLDEGWSPSRIGYGTITLVATGVTLYGYVSHPRHPGAVWWLLAAVTVIAVWALLEAGRWRIKYQRLLAARQASSSASRSKPISKLLAEGKGLQADIGSVNAALGALRVNQPMTGSLPGKIARWEGSVSEALAKQPEILDLFQNAPKVDAARPLSWLAYSRIEYQLTVLEIIVTNHMANSKAASGQEMNLASTVQAELEAYYRRRVSRIYELYEQGHKLRATLGSSGDLKDQGNPDLVNDINQWESLIGNVLIYWSNLYPQLKNAQQKLIFEYTKVLDARERFDRELDILQTAMNHG